MLRVHRGPKPIAAAADVPVGKAIDKGIQPLAGFEIVISVHSLNDSSRCPIQLTQHPTVEFTPLLGRPKAFALRQVRWGKLPNVARQQLLRLEAVIGVRIVNEEREAVPQSEEKL